MTGPHIVVYGLSANDFSDERIEIIEAVLTKAFHGIDCFESIVNDLSFSFVNDPSVMSDNVPIVIIIELLREQSGSHRQLLAERLGENFNLTVSTWRKIKRMKVAVKRFNPEKDGFFSFKSV